MSDRSVGDRELAEVMANHFRLNFDVVEYLAIVNGNLGMNHFRHNDHIAEMSLNNSRLIKNTTF